MTKNPSILPIILLTILTVIALAIGGCTNRHGNGLSPQVSKSKTSDGSANPAADPAKLVQVGRYSAVAALPTEEQIHPLRVMIKVTLPPDVNTVRKAAKYLLWRSGYVLLEPANQKPEVTALLAKSLPQVHRKLGPMELEDALQVLAGPAFHLDIDHIKRAVSYDLNREEQKVVPGMAPDGMNDPDFKTRAGEQS